MNMARLGNTVARLQEPQALQILDASVSGMFES
jgi:hypothetical protein